MEDLEGYRPALKRYLARRLGALQEVEDFVQEVFLRIYRARRRGPLSSPRAFLYATARNLVIDHRRKRASRGEELMSSPPDQTAPPAEDPENRTLLTERTELLRRAIGQLPSRCRQAFVLRKFHHLSYRRIAETMGISEKTVEKHLAKALLLCRDYLLEAERGPTQVIDFESFRRLRIHRGSSRDRRLHDQNREPS